MKKITLSLLSIVFATNFSYAQWTGTTDIYNTNTGNVGVGTTSPFTKFDVQTGTNAHLLFTSTGTDHPTFIFGDASGQPQYGIIKTYDLLVTNGTANFMKIGSSGNIGIGTASPAYSFHISKSTATLALDGITGGFGNSGAAIDLLGWAATNKNWQIGVANIGPAGLNFSSSTLIGGSSFTTPLMTIADNGNVGIGTTSPGYATKLQVAGVGLFTGGSPDPGDGTPAGVSVGYYGTGNYGFIQSMQTGVAYKPLILQPRGGNIGIGTANPDQKLTVKGTIHSQEVVVDMSFLPDYVFKPAYNLPTLTEVKAYIDQNHHLPEMPSADQVAKNGLSLGDMNAKLLKKVEELTLYLIEKDNELKKQKMIIESQEERLKKIEEHLK